MDHVEVICSRETLRYLNIWRMRTSFYSHLVMVIQNELEATDKYIMTMII